MDDAVAAVAERCGGAALAIERVDVRPDELLHVQAHADRRTRWFAVQAGDVSELNPEEDEALPLARDMKRLAGTGTLGVLAWRPGRRITLALDRPGARLVLKGYRRKRLAAAAERYKLAEELFEGGHLHVPSLLSHDEARCCLSIKRVPGQPLVLGLKARERFFRVGSALHAAQERSVHDALPRHGPGDELAVLDQWAGRVRWAAGALPEGWEATRARLDPVAAVMAEPDGRVAHRDFHDGQLIDESGRLALVDFDMLATADTLLDAANLLAHLRLRALQGLHGTTSESVLECGRALLDGLDRAAEPDSRPRLRFYQAATFLRLSLVYRMRPRYALLAAPLVNLAGRCLDDLARR
jgi:hypothetical protein